MNVRLLRKIAKVIREKPKEFYMGRFHDYGPCGTTHCIAGWADFLTNGQQFGRTMERAIAALDITHEQAYRLFFVSAYDQVGWPTRFRGRKDAWKPTPQQAAARIEHFIKTGGRE